MTTLDIERVEAHARRLVSAEPPGPPPAATVERAVSAWHLAVLILVPVLIAATGAYVGASQLDKVYAARSEVVFDVRQLGGMAERYLATQIVVARSRAALVPVAERFALPVRQLEEDLSVETISDSGVLRLQYRNHDQGLALEVTKAVTDQYLVSLREFEQRGGGDHRLLTPTFILEEPIAPKPLRAAALGALAGLAIGASVIALKLQARTAP